MGLYFRLSNLIAATVLLVLVQLSAWIFHEAPSVLSVVVLFAHLTALQAGYLLGSYCLHRGRP